MNPSALRLFVRSILTEAVEKKKEEKKVKKEASLPKSSGKLVDLKKELTALKQMKDELQAAKFAEKTASTEVEFANLAKFASELNKIKAGGVALEQRIDDKIEELETKIESEKNKIREMIGITPKAGQEKMVDEKKEQLPPAPSDEETAANQVYEARFKKVDELRGDIGRKHSSKNRDYGLPYTPKTDYRIGQKFHHNEHGTGEIIKVEPIGAVAQAKDGADIFVKFSKKDEQGNNVFKNIKLHVKTLPSTMREGELEEARFKKGTDIGKKGKGFEKIEKAAAKQYGSKEAGKKVAGAILKKVIKK
jgi:hypothetical protein